MREILFRGKREDNGDWVYGSFIPDLCEVYYGDKLNGFIKPFGKTKEERLMVEVDRKTVGQYTGLKDRNGTRIFEGDILQVEQYGNPGSRSLSINVGEYIDADSDFDYPCIGFYIKIPDGCCNIGALLTDGFEYEVIGNIHDNPELMGVNDG